MADEPFFSSQGSHYEQHQILPDQENIPSSPPKGRSPFVSRSSNLKPRKPPTVTPKRFTKFFTPRPSLNTRSGRRSKAGRQLRDITKNGANRRRQAATVKDDLLQHVESDRMSERPSKRRRLSVDIASSPLQSSPLKHVQTASRFRVFEDEPASPTVSDDDALPDMLEHLDPFPQPVRRLRSGGAPRRVLERSFGGYDAVSRGREGFDHCVDWQAETANFVSTPQDVHSFRPGTALPFCTASCNTNSLVAIGDEEGGLRLIDSALSSGFSTAHVGFRVHANAIMDIAFSSDDFLLATASGDQTGRIVDMHTQQTICVLSGHGSSVKQVRFRPNDDNMITTSSRDGTVQIWDLRCSERGSLQSLRLGQRKGLNEDGIAEPSVRFPQGGMKVGPAHRSFSSTQNSEKSSVSITAIEHLQNGREHLLVTASELSASIKLWDLRNASRRDPGALSSTPLPQSHLMTRNFGVSSMALSGDGARLYTLCKDSTIYAYSTNNLVTGHCPEISAQPGRPRTLREPKTAVGPLYALKHPSLAVGSFYIKLALRPARGEKSEMLAVGNTDTAPLLFPTDERHLPRSQPSADDDDDEDEDDELPISCMASKAGPPMPTSALPVHQQGTALVRGHSKEVTSLSWTHDGDLVTVCDDFTARCWREDAEKAREMRGCGEGGGRRWGHGWAEVDPEWDEDDG